MTREEAIDAIGRLLEMNIRYHCDTSWIDALRMAIESLSAPSGDLISRADAIEAMWKALYAYEDLTEKQFMEHEELELKDWFQHRIFVQRMHEECMKAVESLPSADAEPTVIRAKTFMRKEDFDKWAEDIKKQNKSIVCIPCDAELVSAESVVRCKDCKHYSVEGATQFGWCNALEMPTDEQRFCADGERREP